MLNEFCGEIYSWSAKNIKLRVKKRQILVLPAPTLYYSSQFFAPVAAAMKGAKHHCPQNSSF